MVPAPQSPKPLVGTAYALTVKSEGLTDQIKDVKWEASVHCAGDSTESDW